MLRRRPLLRRVPWRGSPTSTLVLRRSDFSRPGWLGLPLRFPVPADCAGDTRSPRFLGDPYARATSRGPRCGIGSGLPGLSPLRFELDTVAFHGPSRVGLHHDLISGLTLVAHSPAVYASQPPSRCRPRKTRSPAAVLSLTGAGLSPARSLRKVSARYIASSSPKLCLAHAGWPPGIAPRGLPQIRTCGFPASGSSRHGLAARGRSGCVMRGRGSG
jgi:hypothetical protein